MSASVGKCAVIVFFLSVLAFSAGAQAHENWVSAWSAAADTAGPPFQAQTVRQVIRSSIAGDRVRIRLSNELGKQTVHVGAAHLALHAKGAAIVAGSDHALRFKGQAEVNILPGQSVFSDPLKMEVGALQELAVSLYFPGYTGASTQHSAGMATAYVTARGDASGAQELSDFEISSARYFLDDLEVSTAQPASSVVVLGDSITDGVGSTPDANLRWPDQLAARLQADPAFAAIAVVNAGIAGNRLLNDAAQISVGASMRKRYTHDVLAQAGVKHIIVLAGINDIGIATGSAQPSDQVTLAQIVAGLNQLIVRAHAKGVQIAGATLLPFAGSEWPFHTPQGEQQRQALNAWIRKSAGFDAVIDFDQILSDPAHPEKLLSSYDSGDHIHPNDAGYKAMAAAVPLPWLKVGA